MIFWSCDLLVLDLLALQSSGPVIAIFWPVLRSSGPAIALSCDRLVLGSSGPVFFWFCCDLLVLFMESCYRVHKPLQYHASHIRIAIVWLEFACVLSVFEELEHNCLQIVSNEVASLF